MRATLETLVESAKVHGLATASGGKWEAQAYYCGETGEQGVLVTHLGTLMLIVWETEGVEPRSRGWGSMTDKCGIRKVLQNITGQGYAEVYAGFEE